MDYKVEFNFCDTDYARIGKIIGSDGLSDLKRIAEPLKRRGWKLLANYYKYKVYLHHPEYDIISHPIAMTRNGITSLESVLDFMTKCTRQGCITSAEDPN